MAKILRGTKNIKAFAADAVGTERTVFGDTAQSDTLDANFVADFLRGWGIVGSSDLPTKQDFNAMGFTISQALAYLYQFGISDWASAQEYHTTSIVRKTGTYEIYGSLIDNNVGNALPAAVSNSNWQYLGSLASIGGLSAASNAQSDAGSSSSVALVPSNFAQQSKTTSGYQKFPSGLIVQWGVISSATSGTTQTVTFPITFPNANFMGLVGAVLLSPAANAGNLPFNKISTSQFSTKNTDSGTQDLHWIAIGH